MKIGFIGLGIMGTPMAGHILAGGHQLHVNTIGDVPSTLLSAGAKVCATAREVAAASDIIFIMVPDTPHVEEVLFAENGCSETDLHNKIIVDMSSISPIETKKFAEKVRQLGGEYLDAPVSGGEIGAQQASLTIMVGGKPEVFNQVKPLLELMGKNITLVGENGDGQTCKVANQIIVALTIEAVSEALLFAAKAGANPEKVKNALMGGFASSRILEVHGERIIKRNFEPGFKIALHQKDLKLALQGASILGISLPNTATCQELFNSCVANGRGHLDHSAMVNSLELMANYKINHPA
ncbi:2-hydroxy-3-oxopropionate reductase [Pragia fontium]|uniref:2-hydroxy-3-oxopropionate reductase n=1 Tax=Pragia fontium TaxID=82985 RepID=UPI000E0135C4|nr:2-hydroxy-3-oxopropionate reductase [Pragia fontium]SUB81468.1 2-hydroxy-3-oxopropionate reductase [Pragia fontium]